MMNRAPMLRVVLALMTGILIGEYMPRLPLLASGAAMAVGFIVMFFGGYFSKAKRIFLPGLWMTVAAMGCLLTLDFEQQTYRQSLTMPEEYDALQIRLLEVPRESNRCYKSVVRVEGAVIDTMWLPIDCKMIVFLPKDELVGQLDEGQRLWVYSNVNKPDYIDSSTGFDYGRYLRRRGIRWQSYVPMGCWQRCETDAESQKPDAFKQLQRRMVNRLRTRALPPNQLGITEALLLGWRGDVDEDTQRQFREAGITHLLCVSGLHVGLLAGIVGMLMFFLGQRVWQRIVKGLVQIVAIWFFVMLTGGAPSTIRAGVMFSLMLIGGMMNGRSNALNNLATSAVILLMVKPMLLFDVGFQLSYSAVLGINLFNQSLQRLLPMPGGVKWWLLRKIWAWVCLSTSAQLGTLPLVLLYFHQFPLYFLVANLTIVPLSGVLLATSMVVLATGWTGITWLLHKELAIMACITQKVSQWPYAVIDNIYCDSMMAIVMAWVLLLLAWLIKFGLPKQKGHKALDEAI